MTKITKEIMTEIELLDALQDVEKNQDELKKLNDKLIRENICKDQQIEQLQNEVAATKENCIACLDSVKAMLQYSQGAGATHRERNFYSQAIARYIESVRNEMKKSSEPMPF